MNKVKETVDRCSLPLVEIPFTTPYIDWRKNFYLHQNVKINMTYRCRVNFDMITIVRAYNVPRTLILR